MFFFRYLFVSGIRESVHWLSWVTYGITRFLISFVALLIVLMAVPLFPDAVEPSPMVIQAFFTMLSLIIYRCVINSALFAREY